MCGTCNPLSLQGGIVCEDCHGPIYMAEWWTEKFIRKATGHIFFAACECRPSTKWCAVTLKELHARWKECTHEFEVIETKNDKGVVWCLHRVCPKCGYGERLESMPGPRYGLPMYG